MDLHASLRFAKCFDIPFSLMGVISISLILVHLFNPCNYEEADIPAIEDMVKRNGSQRVRKETVDANIFVLAITLFCKINLTELRIEFGNGQNQVYLLVDIMCDVLGIEKFTSIFFMPLQDVIKLHFSQTA